MIAVSYRSSPRPRWRSTLRTSALWRERTWSTLAATRVRNRNWMRLEGRSSKVCRMSFPSTCRFARRHLKTWRTLSKKDGIKQEKIDPRIQSWTLIYYLIYIKSSSFKILKKCLAIKLRREVFCLVWPKDFQLLRNMKSVIKYTNKALKSQTIKFILCLNWSKLCLLTKRYKNLLVLLLPFFADVLMWYQSSCLWIRNKKTINLVNLEIFPSSI